MAYLNVTDAVGNNQVGFVMGKAKLALRPEHTIPRLELGTVVLAVELVDLVSAELDLQLNTVTNYSDSKVVLGYIYNETRCFYVYVSNRVLHIQRLPIQTSGTLCPQIRILLIMQHGLVAAGHLKDFNWLSGPKFLSTPEPSISESTYNLVDPTSDQDIQPLVCTLSSTTLSKQLGSQWFPKFSS